MRQVLILDTETTGLDAEKDRIVEVAVVCYSVEQACVLSAYSHLLDPGCENTAEAVNHIPTAAIPRGLVPCDVWETVEAMSEGCDAVVAHNADFDRAFVRNESEALQGLPWVDTCHAVDWPRTGNSRRLIDLCIDHGLAVVDPHRALSDCLMLARLMRRCAELGHDVSELLAQGLRPTATFQALVSFDDRNLAKAAGFAWEASTKRWLRKMAVEDAAKLGFKVQEVSRG